MYLTLDLTVYPPAKPGKPAQGMTVEDYKRMASYIRMRDTFIVPHGGRSPVTIGRLVREVKTAFPDNRVDVQCSPSNLEEVLTTVPHDVRAVLVDYEESTMGDKWPREDWDKVLSQVTLFVDRIRRAGFMPGLTYPGSPFNPNQKPDYWGWNFKTLDELTGATTAMMQGIADRGLFNQSISRFKKAFGVNNLLGNAYMLCLTGDNAIPTEEAMSCIQYACALGVDECSLWSRDSNLLEEVLYTVRDARLDT